MYVQMKTVDGVCVQVRVCVCVTGKEVGVHVCTGGVCGCVYRRCVDVCRCLWVCKCVYRCSCVQVFVCRVCVQVKPVGACTGVYRWCVGVHVCTSEAGHPALLPSQLMSLVASTILDLIQNMRAFGGI